MFIQVDCYILSALCSLPLYSVQVYFRTGVCRAYPEGYEWKHIPCEHMDIINIACGPTGLVWAIALDGHALVRTHISRDAICGACNYVFCCMIISG